MGAVSVVISNSAPGLQPGSSCAAVLDTEGSYFLPLASSLLPQSICVALGAMLLHLHSCSLGNEGTQPSLFLLCGIQQWCLL